MIDDVKRFFDNWNTLGLVILFAGSGIVIFSLGFNTQGILVIVTGVYAFFAFNQMREMRWERTLKNTPVVRPTFGDHQAYDNETLELRNFGSGPALNLRIFAVLWRNESKITTVSVVEKNWHTHVDEGEAIPVLIGEFKSLSDKTSSLYENYEEKRIELYYTFESNKGVTYPSSWENPTEIDDTEVMEKADQPRTVELAEIRNKCAT